VDPNKTKAMMEQPIPKTLKKLGEFLGLTKLLPQVCEQLWSNRNPYNNIIKEGSIFLD